MTASIQTIQADLDKVVKPLLKEILEKLNNLDSSIKEIIEAAAAKIISEMKNCHCKEEIIVPKNIDEKRYTKTYLYSYPNTSVGNEELGTGKNPNSLTWPFGNPE